MTFQASIPVLITSEKNHSGQRLHLLRTGTHTLDFLLFSQVGDYPCLCLCLGFSQITLIRPFLLMILHFSQIGFTDDLTFTLNPPFKKDRFVL